MIKDKKSRSFNFLIELLIAVLFFALASTICVELFVKAKDNNDLSNDVDNATIIAQGTIEKLKNYKGESLDELLNCTLKDDACTINYDENWKIGGSSYVMVIKEENAITVIDNYKKKYFVVSIIKENTQESLIELNTVTIYSEEE